MVRDLAIDLGTTTISILARGEGVILAEPSVLARVVETGEVVAVGEEAAKMMGRTPDGLEAMRPLRGGAITDFESAEGLIRSFLHRVGVRRINRPRIVVCVPSSITPVEQRAVKEAAHRAGAAEVQLLGYTMAAALGAGLPLDQPVGSMIVDIGGGTTEAAVVSLGGVVATEFRRLGGLDLDQAIQNYVRRRHGLEISLATAEMVKQTIGAAVDPIIVEPIDWAGWTADGGPSDRRHDRPEDSRPNVIAVKGRHGIGGAVEQVTLTALDVADAIHDGVMVMVDAAVACLGWTPPEIAHDLIDNGIHLVGGGALLHGIQDRLAANAKIPVRIVDDPTTVTVVGAGRTLGLFQKLDGFFLTDYTGSFR